MDEMTNSEMVLLIKMILQIIKDTDDKEELIKKIEALLQK